MLFNLFASETDKFVVFLLSEINNLSDLKAVKRTTYAFFN